MKWLSLFRKRCKSDDEDDVNDDSESESLELTTSHSRKRGGAHGAPRPSLDTWFEARKARTAVGLDDTTTTNRLQVTKAGVTMLINRTYIVIKHLGSGTYGQVKLAFNLRNRKLYAIKSLHKPACLAAMATSLSRGRSLQRNRRSISSVSGMQPNAVSVSVPNAAAEGVEPWPSLQPRADSSTHAVQPAETAPQPYSELRLATPVQQVQPPQPQPPQPHLPQPHQPQLKHPETERQPMDSQPPPSPTPTQAFTMGSRPSAPPAQAGGAVGARRVGPRAMGRYQYSSAAGGAFTGASPSVAGMAGAHGAGGPRAPHGSASFPPAHPAAAATGVGGQQAWSQGRAGMAASWGPPPSSSGLGVSKQVGCSVQQQGRLPGSWNGAPGTATAEPLAQVCPPAAATATGMQPPPPALMPAALLPHPTTQPSPTLATSPCMDLQARAQQSSPGTSTWSHGGAGALQAVQGSPAGLPNPASASCQGPAPGPAPAPVPDKQPKRDQGAAPPSLTAHKSSSWSKGGARRLHSLLRRGDGQACSPAPSHHQEEGEQGLNRGSSGAQQRAEEFVREIAIMKKLSHPNIVRLVEVIDDPGSDNLLLVMEYVEGESLHPRRIDALNWHPVPEPEAWRRARDVLLGLDYLHVHGVVHGDLKPANLMLDANTHQVKIVDFGSAVLTGGGTPGSSLPPAGAMTCTPAFRSPETLQSGYVPSFEMDMWALGVTIFLWVFGQLPFNGAMPFLIYESIRRQELNIPTALYTSEELKDFLGKVLNKDPRRRLDVVGALQHPWITGRGRAPLPILPRPPPSTPHPDCMDIDESLSPVGRRAAASRQQADAAQAGAGAWTSPAATQLVREAGTGDASHDGQQLHTSRTSNQVSPAMVAFTAQPTLVLLPPQEHHQQQRQQQDQQDRQDQQQQGSGKVPAQPPALLQLQRSHRRSGASSPTLRCPSALTPPDPSHSPDHSPCHQRGASALHSSPLFQATYEAPASLVPSGTTAATAAAAAAAAGAGSASLHLPTATLPGAAAAAASSPTRGPLLQRHPGGEGCLSPSSRSCSELPGLGRAWTAVPARNCQQAAARSSISIDGPQLPFPTLPPPSSPRNPSPNPHSPWPGQPPSAGPKPLAAYQSAAPPACFVGAAQGGSSGSSSAWVDATARQLGCGSWAQQAAGSGARGLACIGGAAGGASGNSKGPGCPHSSGATLPASQPLACQSETGPGWPACGAGGAQAPAGAAGVPAAKRVMGRERSCSSRSLPAGTGVQAGVQEEAAQGQQQGGPQPGSEGQRRGKAGAARLAPQRSFVNLKQPSPMDRVSRIMGGGAVSDLMSSVFYEVRLPPRTQLIAAGDTVDAIYLIAQGEVEIYQQLLLEEVEGVAPASPCQLPSQDQQQGRGLPALALQQAAAGSERLPGHVCVSMEQGAALLPGAVGSAGGAEATCAAQLSAAAGPLGRQGFTQPGQQAEGMMLDEPHGDAAMGAPPCGVNDQPPHAAWQQQPQKAASVSQQWSGQHSHPTSHRPSFCALSAAASLAQPIITGIPGSCSLAGAEEGGDDEEEEDESNESFLFTLSHLQQLTHYLAAAGPHPPGAGPTSSDPHTHPSSLPHSSTPGGQTSGSPTTSQLSPEQPSFATTASLRQPATAAVIARLWSGALRQISSGLAAADNSHSQPVDPSRPSQPQPCLSHLSGQPGTLGAVSSQGVAQELPAGSLRLAQGQGTLDPCPCPTQSLTALSNQSRSPPTSDRSLLGPDTTASAQGGWVRPYSSSIEPGREGESMGQGQGQEDAGQGQVVLVLATKGPGDSLGFTSLDVRHAAAAAAAAAYPSPAWTGGAAASPKEPLSSAACPTADSPSQLGRGASHGSQADVAGVAASTGLGLASGGGGAMPKPVWRASVRSKGEEVVLFKAEVDHIQRLVLLHPEMAAAMKHIAGQQETDLMVAEALRQLRLASSGLVPPVAEAAGGAGGSGQQGTGHRRSRLPGF